MLDVPRSVRLATWGSAVLTGEARVQEAVAAICADDEPHHVIFATPDASEVPAAELADLFAALAAAGTPGLDVVLPAPGDPAGLPGPAAFTAAAIEAGECVLVRRPATDDGPAGHRHLHGFVPRVQTFGSAWEPGQVVTWDGHPVADRPLPYLTGLADAERDLRVGLGRAAQALAELDVARWRPDAAARIAALREGTLARNSVPPRFPARSRAVLAAAAQVRDIVVLAREDDGAAITGQEATARSRVLQDLAALSRRAMVAAVNAVHEPRH